MADEPYRGSLDPFEDIVDQLVKLGVAYCLLIGMDSSPVTTVWSNTRSYGREGLHNFRNAADSEWRRVAAALDAEETP